MLICHDASEVTIYGFRYLVAVTLTAVISDVLTPHDLLTNPENVIEREYIFQESCSVMF